MKDKIIKCLKTFTEISDWTVDINHKSKKELYLIFNQPESIRQIDTDSYQLAIFVNQEQEGKQYTGTASISILPNSDETSIKKQISEAIFAAKLVLNPIYQIAECHKENINHDICDPNISKDLNFTLNNVKETLVNAIEKEADVRMSSAEIMLSINDRNFVTSKGLDTKSSDSEILFELVLLSGEGDKESETFTLREERFLDVLDIENIVSQYAKYTRENVDAVLPETGKFKVILTEESLSEFFNYYAYQVSAAAIFNKSSKFKIGENIVQSPNKDLLNMSYDPSLRGGLRSKNYDQYALPLNKFKVIDKGVFTTAQADSRYGSYLNIPINGAATNIVIEPGDQSLQDLLEDNTYIFSRFSSFEPDPVTGAFSGEVRNGVLYRDNKFIPVKGGSVTGVIDDAMQAVWFSKETKQSNNYFGPKYIKFVDIDVTG